MKYSFIFPYYARPELAITLANYYMHYGDREDWEVVVIEDTKNFASDKLHSDLINIIQSYPQIPIRLILDTKVSYNSASKYNRGVEAALGDIVILSNPETIHIENVLKYLDDKSFENSYYVFDCFAGRIMGERLEFVEWYQHATINRKYHFCSALSSFNYRRIGGFNERCCDGIAYEDDIFLQRVKQSGLHIHTVDTVTVCHVEHPRDYGLPPEDKQRLVNINQNLWVELLAKGVF